jgi:c-di-AMP phosphodiesterase-like protein
MSLLRYFLAIDMVSPKINLLHHSSTNINTYIGSTVTLIIITFFICSAVYFGSDIIFKEQPITRFSKQYTSESRIYIKDYPIQILILDSSGNVANYKQYLEIKASYIRLRMDTDYLSSDNLIVETCRDEFISEERRALFKSSGEYFFNNSLCINTFKYYSEDGTLIEEDVFILNTYGWIIQLA